METGRRTSTTLPRQRPWFSSFSSWLYPCFIHTNWPGRGRGSSSQWLLVPGVSGPPVGTTFQADHAVEFVGYIGRAMSSSQSPNWTIGPYVMQSTLLLVAPALFAASIYMELGRIITLVRGEKLAIIRVSWMTKIFVAGDVLSFLMQASGQTI